MADISIGKNNKKLSYKPASALKFRIDESGNLRASVSASAGEFSLTPEIIHLLCLLQQGIPEAGLAARLRQDFKQISANLPPQEEVNELISEMTQAGCVIPIGADNSSAAGLDDGFGDPWIQWAMLSDKPRCSAYQKAIGGAVGDHSVVVDVGAGTGLLSLYACKAGAREIHCIEETSSANILSGVIKNMSSAERERFKIHRKNSADAILPDKVTHIISELFGNDPLQEGVVPTLRDVFSRAGGSRTVGIPESVEIFCNFTDIRKGPLKNRIERLISDDSSATADWWTPVRTIMKMINFDDVSFAHPVRESDLRVSGGFHSCFKIPLAPPPAANARLPYTNYGHKFTERDECPVLILGFRAHLTAGITISNLPGEKDECEHWSPVIVPVRRRPALNEVFSARVSVSGDWQKITAEITDAKNKVIGSRR